MSDINPISKRWASIRRTTKEGPVGRTTLYGLAGQHPGLFRKSGRKVVVDLEMLDRILEALPLATIKPPADFRESD
jgi:hypothetical protein